MFQMGLNHVFLDFFTHAAIGAAATLLLILSVGVGMPSRSSVRHTSRKP